MAKRKTRKEVRRRNKASKAAKRREDLWTALWFLIKFNLLAVPIYIIIWLDLSWPAMQELVAQISYSILKFFGYNVVIEGIRIGMMSENVIANALITFDCTGWKARYALLALTIATPIIAWKKKAKFLVVALPVLFAINILRIVFTITTAFRIGFEHLEFVHSVLWSQGMIIVVVAIWYLWMRREVFKDNLFEGNWLKVAFNTKKRN